MAFIFPLDLRFLLVNTLSGSYYIFLFLLLILIGGLAAKFRMPNVIALIMFGLFAIIIDNQNTSGFYVFTGIFAGLVAFFSISRIMKN